MALVATNRQENGGSTGVYRKNIDFVYIVYGLWGRNPSEQCTLDMIWQTIIKRAKSKATISTPPLSYMPSIDSIDVFRH